MSTPYLITYIVLWLLVAVEAVGLLALYHHFAQMYLATREGRDSHGLPEGTKVARAFYRDLSGRRIALPARDRPQLLIFTEHVCPLCERLRPDIRAFAERSEVEIAVVCVGPLEEVRRWAQPLGKAVTTIPDPGGRIAARFKVGLSPFLIGMNAAGTVRARAIVNDVKGVEWAAERLSVSPIDITDDVVVMA
jgi:hypothetical protein